MGRKGFARAVAVMAALAITAQGMEAVHPTFANDEQIKVRTNSQTQMNSEREAVYVSTYGQESDRTENFDSNWKFNLGDVSGAEGTTFDDSRWRQINLPHDYSIEQEFSKSMEAESGYLPGGIGWYRKNFVLEESMKDKEIRIDFDGVYMDATVWVNGVQLGTHPYGYSPFSFDITDHVKFGQENVIAVKVNHQIPSSRWYSGSGIYRSVNLTMTDKIHVDLNGTHIVNDMDEGNNIRGMVIDTKVVNSGATDANVELVHTVYEKGNDQFVQATASVPAQTVAANTAGNIQATVNVPDLKLWSTENPNMYVVRTEVRVDGTVVDTYDTDYGFRYFDIDKDTGFSLNGQKMKLKGVCMHHDQGALGAVNNRRAVERQVEILKEMGCNSIRVTHNPASQNLIDICNEKGILVIEEMFDGWIHPKNGNSQDFARFFNQAVGAENHVLGATPEMTWAQFSLQSTMKRDINAPSIIMWSLGNEIQEGAGGTGYAAKAPDLIRWASEIDQDRPLTVGSNAVWRDDAEQCQVADLLTEAGGLSGTNYSGAVRYDQLRQKHPTWTIYGSETASSINSRGIYKNTPKQCVAYDDSKVSWGAFANDAWRDVIERDFISGEYVWTGFDYIGEPTPWNGTDAGPKNGWPSPKSSYFGIIDTAGFPKDSYYLYQSVWNEKVNTLHVLPAWNSDVVAKDGAGKVKVVVYTDAPEAELFFTGTDGTRTSLGKKSFIKKTSQGGAYTYQVNKDQQNLMYLTWLVPYADGTLEAVAYDENHQVITQTEGRNIVSTAGAPAKLQVTADRTEILADGTDLSYITVDVLDAKGNMVPNAQDRIKFNVTGGGVLVGVDNGNSPDHDSYKGSSRKAFSGKALAIVQSTKNAEPITVTATAEGLDGATVTINTVEVPGTTKEKQVDSFYMSRTYYVKIGNQPQLPAEIEVRYTDGTSKMKPVQWANVSDEQIQSAGAFSIPGTINANNMDYSVNVNVNMMDKVGALLNYSTATPKGVEPILPDARQAVMEDGTIMNAAFPITWNKPDASVYDTVGTVEINGVANVLGEELPVTATVRVQEETIALGDSVSGSAHLTQNIDPSEQSDTLEAIKDGDTAISDNMSGGANPSAWSNWQASQKGKNKAEITFRYDTQQRIGQAVVHFAKDAGSMRYPDAGSTEIWISETGADNTWTKVDVKETIGTEDGRVKPYTYDFAPVTATFVKLKITNTATPTGGSAKPCTAITEVELKEAKGAFKVNSSTKLKELTVNGHMIGEEDLNKGSTDTQALFAEVAAAGEGNAAVTVLPAYQDVIRIIVEAEDHSERSVFEVNLNKEPSTDSGDDSRDYPRQDTVGMADSAYSGSATEGPAEYVTDNDPGTHWHTNWSTEEGKNINNRWIGLDLKKPVMIDGIRSLPRQSGGTNGSVTEYRVEYKLNEADPWTEVAKGNWDINDRNWQVVNFPAPVEARYVRVVGVHTSAASGADAHMSMAELRATVPMVKTDLATLAVEVPAEVTVDVVDAENPAMPKATVKDGETELSYGYDYLLTYENNTAPGMAKVTVTGIGAYEGTVEKEFMINLAGEKVLDTITVQTQPSKVIYNEGESFDPAGLVITLNYTDKTSEDVAYADAAAQFEFAPALDVQLTEADKKVTVTYNGKTADIDITVNKVLPPVDRTELDQAIANAEAVDLNKYEDGQEKIDFVSALQAAKNITAESTQEEVDAAAAALADAQSKLKEKTEPSVTPEPTDKPEPTPKPSVTPDPIGPTPSVTPEDKTKLEEKFEESDKIINEGYTIESWAAFNKALEEAKKVLADKNATQKEIDDAYEALAAAANGLTVVPGPTDKPEPTTVPTVVPATPEPTKAPTVVPPSIKPDQPSSGNNVKPGNGVNTGDTAHVFGFSVTALLSLAALALIIKKYGFGKVK